jgi:hypothetical protein
MTKARFLLLLLLLVVWPWPAHAAAPIVVGNGTPGSCTEEALRYALAVAGASGGGTIHFKCGRQPVTIFVSEVVVPPDNTTIDGRGLITLQAPFIDGALLDGVVSIEPGTTVHLKKLAIQSGLWGISNGGMLILEQSTISGGFFHNIINNGTLTIRNSSICCEVFDLQGGSINNWGTLSVHNSIFSDSFGGAIYNAGITVVKNTVFRDNQFQGGPGGALSNDGDATVSNSQFLNNVALSRGGAINNNGRLVLENSAVSGNIASFGGGIFNAGMIDVRNSAITRNTARVDGGGVSTCCGGVTALRRTTVSGNTPNDVVP